MRHPPLIQRIVVLFALLAAGGCRLQQSSGVKANLAATVQKTVPELPLDSTVTSNLSVFRGTDEQRIRVTFLNKGANGAAFTYSLPGSDEIHVLKLPFAGESAAFDDEKTFFADAAKLSSDPSDAKLMAPYFIAAEPVHVVGPTGQQGDALIKPFIDGHTVAEALLLAGDDEKAEIQRQLDALYDAHKAAWANHHMYLDLHLGNIMWNGTALKIVDGSRFAPGLPLTYRFGAEKQLWTETRWLADTERDKYKKGADQPPSTPGNDPVLLDQDRVVKLLDTPEGSAALVAELTAVPTPDAPEAGTDYVRSQALSAAQRAARPKAAPTGIAAQGARDGGNQLPSKDTSDKGGEQSAAHANPAQDAHGR